LANIRVIFENNSEPAAKSVKKTCGTGISLILRQLNRERPTAATPSEHLTNWEAGK
jgi:hypothetical protein